MRHILIELLDALDMFKGLHALSLSYSNLSDITTLRNLKKFLLRLHNIYLQIRCLDLLELHRKLEKLHLPDCPIGEISVISSHLRLEDFEIASCPIRDLTLVRNVTSLRKLDCEARGPEDLAASGNLDNMTNVKVIEDAEKILDFVQNLKALTHLS
jgi:hypothetical protein